MGKICTPYIIIPWSRVPLEKLTCFKLVKLPTFYGTRSFIMAFTSAYHLSLCWATAQVRSSLYECFVTRYIFVSTPPPFFQAGGPPLVGCPRLLIRYIRSLPPYCRPFLHPQPEDAPWRGDRDRLITGDK